jgi:hypothetical protein
MASFPLGGRIMTDRAYLTRLRTDGGPSHDLLVLLDRHRVMTTDQLGRATATPDRTVRYRMERLGDAGLVECARPGRERGSAPRHWWLRAAGARLVTGSAPAEGRPSGMFVAHAAAITEVWLALVEHGPAIGIEVSGWLTDRAGWQEWTRQGRWTSHPYRLTPDAVATVRPGDAVFIEVDLATMTQTLLKQKVLRYLAYAADRVWEDTFPQCPPMLLLTTTPTRAATFARVAGQVLARALDIRDPAGLLVVAACGLVRDPAQAIVEPCWSPTEPGAAELTLAELLAERVEARAASDAWFVEQDTVVRRRNALDTLRDVRNFGGLPTWLGSEPASEVLRFFIGSDPAVFLDGEPGLAAEVIDWFEQRRRLNRFRARDLAVPLVAALEPRHKLYGSPRSGASAPPSSTSRPTIRVCIGLCRSSRRAIWSGPTTWPSWTRRRPRPGRESRRRSSTAIPSAGQRPSTASGWPSTGVPDAASPERISSPPTTLRTVCLRHVRPAICADGGGRHHDLQRVRRHPAQLVRPSRASANHCPTGHPAGKLFASSSPCRARIGAPRGRRRPVTRSSNG